MNPSRLARAFNEWMRRYTENPEQFEAEFATVRQFLDDRAAGIEPTYGEEQAAYLLKLMEELGDEPA